MDKNILKDKFNFSIKDYAHFSLLHEITHCNKKEDSMSKFEREANADFGLHIIEAGMGTVVIRDIGIEQIVNSKTDRQPIAVLIQNPNIAGYPVSFAE